MSRPRRRTGFTVALVGADGAGKTTVARRLEREGALPLKYLYMGSNPSASNHLLPSTRLWLALRRLAGRPPHQGGPPSLGFAPPSLGAGRRALVSLKRGLRLLQRLGEEWYRQGLAWHYQRRGSVVLFDRHFFADYYAHDIAPTCGDAPLSARLHGWMLDRVYPRPQLVLLLDAPTSVLWARKREGTPEQIDSRRREYLALEAVVPRFETVDADRGIEEVTADVAERIRRHQERLVG